MTVSPELLRILHAVRLLGFAGTDEIADRAGATRDAASAFLPGTDGRLTTNDHSDLARDARILDELEHLSTALAPLIARLTAVLPRFAGYDDRAGDGAGDDRVGGQEGPRADR